MDACGRPRNLHDIRTHLTVIKGYAQLTRRELDQSDATPRCRKYLVTLESQIERMRSMLADWERTNAHQASSEIKNREQRSQECPDDAS
ncbi:MAG: histidine kinase dimerization/phospho-acceptor domain-containing protein [Nitrolancea sp.]